MCIRDRFKLNREIPAVEIKAQVKCRGVTGVEMEALTAVSAAALTVYDMCKACLLYTSCSAFLLSFQIPFLFRSGLSFLTKMAAASIFRASPGKNGKTHDRRDVQSGVPVLIMNHAVPKA